MYKFKILKDIDFKDKTVLLRVDFNLPIDNEINILSNYRIEVAMPTIEYLLKEKAKIIIASHFGQPEGKIVEELRLDKIADLLSQIIKQPVKKLNSTIGLEVEQAIFEMQAGDIIMLENIQFEAGEINNSEDYAQKLASYADIFVFDAFGQAHRNYASISTIQKFIPSCAGFIIQKEIDNITKIINHPQKPLMAIIGGAKPDKINVLKELIPKFDKIMIGGVLANTFLKAQGIEIGSSKFDEPSLKLAQEVLKLAKDKIILPTDLLVANEFNNNALARIVDIHNISSSEIALDLGPQTIKNYQEILKDAQTIIWSGSIGVFEFSNFSYSTENISKFISNLNAIIIIGGGDTAMAIEKLNLMDKMTYVSTGGGAFLKFIQGQDLPGIKALEENNKKFNN